MQYCLPKPVYVPAACVPAPSRAHFVEELRAEGAGAASCTGTAPCSMQAPQACLLCSKGVVFPPALWDPCDPEHHSWAEAMKRVLWKVDQVQGFSMLPAWRRRTLTNFTAVLTYTKPGHVHYGRMKVCMRHLVGCVTCARVNWIDNVVSCYLATIQRTRTSRTTEKCRRQAEFFSERTQSATYVMQQPSTLSLTFENMAAHGLSFLWRNFMHPLFSTPRVRITAGLSTPGGYQCGAEPTWLQQPPPVTMLQSTQLLPLPMSLSSRLAPHIQKQLCAHAFTAPKPWADRRERFLFCALGNLN